MSQEQINKLRRTLRGEIHTTRGTSLPCPDGPDPEPPPPRCLECQAKRVRVTDLVRELRELRDLTGRMRVYQRAYFQTPNQTALRSAKSLEAQVDQLLKGQGGLFT